MTIDVPYLTSPLLDRLPWLAHGFGTAAWPQAEFVRFAAARGWTPVIMDQVHGDTIHVLTGDLFRHGGEHGIPSSVLGHEGDHLRRSGGRGIPPSVLGHEGDLLRHGGGRGIPPSVLGHEGDHLRRSGGHGIHSSVLGHEGPPAAKLSGDGLVTSVPGLCLVIRTADCLPVLLADPGLRLVAAVHCGWRSTQKRILARAVDILAGLGADPGALRAAFGPSIGAACYEVGAEVREAFDAAGFPPDVFRDVPGRPRRAFLDLPRANSGLLAERGVPAGNIAADGPCTHCEPGLLSHRRDPAGEARMINFVVVERGRR